MYHNLVKKEVVVVEISEVAVEVAVEISEEAVEVAVEILEVAVEVAVEVVVETLEVAVEVVVEVTVEVTVDLRKAIEKKNIIYIIHILLFILCNNFKISL